MNEFQNIQKAKILAMYGNTEIVKSDDNDLEKGEGSRGGKVIGHTKSGKPIYASASHEGHSGFSNEDHQDAAGLHTQKEKEWDAKMPKSNRSARVSTANDKANHHYDQAQEHLGKITKSDDNDLDSPSFDDLENMDDLEKEV